MEIVAFVIIISTPSADVSDGKCRINSILSEDKSECLSDPGFEMNKTTNICDFATPEIPSLIPAADPEDYEPMTPENVLFPPTNIEINNNNTYSKEK